MGIAGVVNMAMLVIAAALFFGTASGVDTIEEAHASFAAALGGSAALAFAVASWRPDLLLRQSAPTPARW